MVAGLVRLRGPRLVTLAVVSVVLLYDRQVVELALLQPQWGARRSERIRSNNAPGPSPVSGAVRDISVRVDAGIHHRVGAVWR